MITESTHNTETRLKTQEKTERATTHTLGHKLQTENTTQWQDEQGVITPKQKQVQLQDEEQHKDK